MRPLAVLLLLACAACADESEPRASVGAPAAAAPVVASARVVAGQTVYVPVYSHVYSGNRRRPVNLAATLGVRNADPTAPIRLTAVRYYDDDGALVRSYLPQPVVIGPLAARDFAVDEGDTAGGFGAAFVVEWTADRRVASPVVEAVMIGTASQQGISFVSAGRVVAEVGAVPESE